MSILLFLMLILDPFKGIHKVQAKGTRGPSRCTDKVSFGLSLADMDGQTSNYPRLANLHSLIQPNERTLPPLSYPIFLDIIPPEERAIPRSLGRRMRKSQACLKGLRVFS
ncbi:hypothetical protein J3E69DRAFT_357270 [Trichoderma sp. SZMC 28015]